MHPSIAHVAGQFELGTNLFLRALHGLDEHALHRRPGDWSNPMVWIAGHVTRSRVNVLNVMGSGRELPWGDLFATGSRLLERERYPAADELRGTWHDVSRELQTSLRALDEVTLAELPAARVPSIDGTLTGAIHFFALHDAYHIGQMGYVRKWLGMSPVFEG